MPIVNKPDINYGVWAENGNIEIPSSEKVEEGWVIEKPLNEHMNWLQNRSDKMLQYINQRGMPEWDFRTTYPIDAYVIRSGVMYQAVSQNTDTDPSLNTNIWNIPFASNSGLGSSATEIEKIKNQDGYLSYYVRKSDPVMLAPAKGVAYNNPTDVSGFTFSGTTPVISSNGTTVAQFSGGTSPKDVVTHEQLALQLQIYKIGDIYTTTGSGDPSTRLGYGTWERFGEGRALVGFSTDVSNDVPQWVKSVDSEFGDYKHKLTVDEMPIHKHGYEASHEYGGGTPDPTGWFSTNSTGPIVSHSEDEPDGSGVSSNGSGNSMYSTGGDEPHNNVQPSIVVYLWKRIT